jgi:hypothetical protein
MATSGALHVFGSLATLVVRLGSDDAGRPQTRIRRRHRLHPSRRRREPTTKSRAPWSRANSRIFTTGEPSGSWLRPRCPPGRLLAFRIPAWLTCRLRRKFRPAAQARPADSGKWGGHRISHAAGAPDTGRAGENRRVDARTSQGALAIHGAYSYGAPRRGAPCGCRRRRRAPVPELRVRCSGIPRAEYLSDVSFERLGARAVAAVHAQKRRFAAG